MQRREDFDESWCARAKTRRIDRRVKPHRRYGACSTHWTFCPSGSSRSRTAAKFKPAQKHDAAKSSPSMNALALRRSAADRPHRAAKRLLQHGHCKALNAQIAQHQTEKPFGASVRASAPSDPFPRRCKDRSRHPRRFQATAIAWPNCQ